MSKYTEVLEFFMENGISLNKDQMNNLKVVCTEGFFDRFKKKSDNKKDNTTTTEYQCKELLENALKFAKSPFTLGDGYDSDILAILNKLGLTTEGLSKLISSNKGTLKNLKAEEYTGGNWEGSESDLNKLDNALYILENDDYLCFYCTLDKKIYEVSCAKDVLYKYNISNEDLSFTDWEDFIKTSEKNGNIIEQIRNIIKKYK